MLCFSENSVGRTRSLPSGLFKVEAEGKWEAYTTKLNLLSTLSSNLENFFEEGAVLKYILLQEKQHQRSNNSSVLAKYGMKLKLLKQISSKATIVVLKF